MSKPGQRHLSQLGSGSLKTHSARGREKRHQELTNVTVDQRPDDHVVVPYDGVDKLNEASDTNPGHVEASAGVPSCEKF